MGLFLDDDFFRAYEADFKLTFTYDNENTFA